MCMCEQQFSLIVSGHAYRLNGIFPIRLVELVEFGEFN